MGVLCTGQLVDMSHQLSLKDFMENEGEGVKANHVMSDSDRSSPHKQGTGETMFRDLNAATSPPTATQGSLTTRMADGIPTMSHAGTPRSFAGNTGVSQPTQLLATQMGLPCRRQQHPLTLSLCWPCCHRQDCYHHHSCSNNGLSPYLDKDFWHGCLNNSKK